METKINWHRYGTKLRQCHFMYPVPKSLGAKDDFLHFRSSEQHADVAAFDWRRVTSY